MPFLKLALISYSLILFSSLSFSAYEPPLKPWQDKTYIQKAFNEIALKNEYKTTQTRVLKWKQPIRYEFIYQNLKTNLLVENLFNHHLKHLQNITGHSIQPHKSHHRNKANLSIYLTADKTYNTTIQSASKTRVKDLHTKSHCMASFKHNQKNEIIEAQIVIPVDHVFSKGLLVACIVEEATQILGLPNDSNWVNPSIANDASKIEFLTGLDYLLLKILYDKNLKAGIPYSQNQKIIKRIIKNLEFSGEIKHASKTINNDGLFLLLN